MSTSLPSKEIYSVDVPEVREFTAQFRYNFFIPDECVSDSGGVPTTMLQRASGESNARFLHRASTRLPRMVVLEWRPVRLADTGNGVSDVSIRNNVMSNVQNGSLIADNLDKVVSEDRFASNDFVAVTFNDAEIDDKVHYLVSGSYVLRSLERDHDPNVSGFKAAARLTAMTPKSVTNDFVVKSLNVQSRLSGVRFFDSTSKRLYDKRFTRLKKVSIDVQVNGKLFSGIVNRTINDPDAPFTTDMRHLQTYAAKLKHQISQHSTPEVTENDYKGFVPYVSLHAQDVTTHPDRYGAVIVGYIIDKVEQLADGTVRTCAPIVIDNPNSNSAIDPNVRYDSTYAYTVRSVAQYTVPAIDDDTGDVAIIKVLVSSRPSNKAYVRTTEIVSPPVPSDVSFTWDYARINPTTAEFDPLTTAPIPRTGVAGSLMIHWTFPPNSQRDIKRFQVFRRRNVHEPFELIKEYDFDDSEVRFDNGERPDPSLVEKLTSPRTYFYDDDFNVDDRDGAGSSYIYAVASIDAHGFTSGYSTQFEVEFDRFKNQLRKRLISHSGAPKPYPNLYIGVDTFVDTVRVSHKKRLKLYFNPEHAYLYDDNDRLRRLIATKQTNGAYKLLFINVDNQKSAIVNVSIDDRSDVLPNATSQREIVFGAGRTSSSGRAG